MPVLIDLLRGRQSSDPMLRIVNRDASPVLAHEAWVSLRRVTGALLPQQPARWQEFWDREHDKVVLAPVRETGTGVRRATRAQGGFFGIPVVGREVVFILDTSHSMRDQIAPFEGGGKVPKVVQRIRRSRRRAGQRWNRLDAVKEQVLVAVAGMHDRSRYRIVSFADRVHAWHEKSVAARHHSLRKLMKTLESMQPAGFTNTHAALQTVLGGQRLAGAGGGYEAGQVDEVFLMSDGEPSVGDVQDVEKLLAAVRRANRYRQIRINTVFTGGGKGWRFMERLAAENHGVFVHYGG